MNEQRNLRYDSIIDLPHHQSATRKHMSMIDRAAQFSPFAALTGYGDCIKETARVTEERIELDEAEQAAISEKLYDLQTRLEQMPRGQIPGITIKFFVPDKTKAGGRYVTITGAVKKVDAFEHMVGMADGSRISMDNIVSIAENESDNLINE